MQIKPFDAYEIHGCITASDEQGGYTEQCDDSEAQFWTLYGPIPGAGGAATGHFKTRALAEEVLARINPPVKQAAEELLHAAQWALDHYDGKHMGANTVDLLRSAIAKAKGA